VAVSGCRNVPASSDLTPRGRRQDRLPDLPENAKRDILQVTHHDSSLVRFHRLIETARMPCRADKSALGTLPVRAVRYCEAATSACAYGWWVFPPCDLWLLWDGADIFWRVGAGLDWIPLLASAQFPDFAAGFDAAAPPDVAGCSPPFLSALPEPGTVQIWTGLIARTIADWHLLVRAPANLPAMGGFVLYEGIIESDRWFGPLFTNLRITRTHVPIRLRPDFPLLQVQPLPGYAYSDGVLRSIAVSRDLSALTEADWDDYRSTIVEPNRAPDRPHGRYAASARKRHGGRTAGCPAHGGQAV